MDDEQIKLDAANDEIDYLRHELDSANDKIDYLRRELDAANDRFAQMNTPTGREIELTMVIARIRKLCDDSKVKEDS